jgi:PAS domain S-box-containing protein
MSRDAKGADGGARLQFQPNQVDWNLVCSRISDLVIVVDEKHRILWANQSMAARFGMQTQGMIGKHCYTYFHGSAKAPSFCPHSKSLNDGRKHTAVVRKGPSGSSFEVTTSPIKDNGGKIIATVHVARPLQDGEKRTAAKGQDSGHAHRGADRPSYDELEEALHDCEEKYRTALEHSLIGLYRTTPDGRILLVNQALLGMLGYESFDELAKRNLEKAGYEPDYPRSKFVEQVEKKSVVMGLESAWVRNDGSTLYVRESARAIRDSDGQTIYYEGTVEDITEQKMASQQLQEAHDRLNATLNALPDLMFEVDQHGTIVDFRAPDPAILYTVPGEFLGKKVPDCIPKPAAVTIMRTIKKAVRTGKESGATYSLQVDGRTNWFELSLAIKGEEKDRNRHFIALVRNITDRKETENELRRTTQELETERTELTEKNIALKQILDHIAREKEDYRRRLAQNLERALRPLLRKLGSKASASGRDIEELEASLLALVDKESGSFQSRFDKLTPREKEICEMIVKGFSSKEISDSLIVSPATIHKHREQIRKKLGITNKSINLNSYLRSNLSEDRTQ